MLYPVGFLFNNFSCSVPCLLNVYLYNLKKKILQIFSSRAVQETTFDLEGDVHSGTALPVSKVLYYKSYDT